MTNYSFLLHLSMLGLVYGWCPWVFSLFLNPNTPEFLVHEFYLQMSPNTTHDTEFLQVNATDMDVNDTLLYSLEDFPFIDYIRIDQDTGVLSTNKSFDDVNVLLLDFYVIVRDRETFQDAACKTDKTKVIIELIALLEKI